MKITKGTIIRTLLIIVVMINFVLEKFGIDLIPADESTITIFVETALEIAVIIVGFWKNNSYSKHAIRADKFLRQLRGEA